MESLADTLRTVESLLGEAVSDAFGPVAVRGLADDDVLGLMAQAAAVSRLAEALMIATIAEVHERVDSAPHPERPTTRTGCRSVRELVQRTTRASGRTVTDLVAAGLALQQHVAPTSGIALPARYPALREATADGVVGLDAVAAVVSALEGAACELRVRHAADAELAAAARGAGEDGAPMPCADDLRLQAQVWAAYLDQDGAEPRERRALRKRGFTLGVCRDGLVPVCGQLLPDVAGQLQRLFDSILNPKGEGPDAPAGPHFVDAEEVDPYQPSADARSAAQRHHDALATIVTVAARAGELPTIGGAAPTLVVSVDAADLAAGRGQAHIDGCGEPVSLDVARQVACVGAVQRVTTDAGGRILAIHISDRVFAAHQRRAISLRDGGCIIPGCHVRAAWCEIHHVTEHAAGGPTHTDNGVLLCWYHHRTLGTSGWKVRMRRGVPEVRGPSWWDDAQRWRAVTSSPTRLSRRLRSRSPGG